MSSFQPINPKPFLKTLINKQVVVRLKWNKTEYKGVLLSIDNYMNLQLDDTYEIIPTAEDGEKKEELIGEIFIRCNNVLFIREAANAINGPTEPTETANADLKEEDMDNGN